MSEQLKEALSAVIDGEADEFEARRVLDELAKDDELKAKWDRYHVIASVLRGDTVDGGRATTLWERDVPDADEVDAVSSAAAVKAAPAARSRFGRLTGVAVAAGVALAVVLFVDQGDSNGGSPQAGAIAQTEIIDTPVAAAFVPVEPVRAEATTAAPSKLDLHRARAYMLHHAQTVSMSNRTSTIPFVKVAAFEP